MIETEQSVTVDVGIDDVWSQVRDIQRWASLMPGLRECEVLDADRSRWVLKVGAGGLVRTVRVHVHVRAWDGPAHVSFAYELEGDPVQGHGTYHARALGPNRTEVTLWVQVIGSGPMAAMWEAMGKPLLPQFARAFAQQLKAKIEAEMPVIGTVGTQTAPQPAILRRLLRRIGTLFGMPAKDAAMERKPMS